MNIDPITITMSAGGFAALCILLAAQLTVALLNILNLIDKPKRNKRY